MGQEREIFIEQKQNASGGDYLLFCELDKIFIKVFKLSNLIFYFPVMFIYCLIITN